MTDDVIEGVKILAPVPAECASVLSPEAVTFLAKLQRTFGKRRNELLAARVARAMTLATTAFDFLPETANVRAADWKVAPAPRDLDDRRVEITGPAESKMMINALNSGAKVFMADLEDALSPTWSNVIRGQLALQQAVRRTLSFTSAEGKKYALGTTLATLVVRPRGWHLPERHFTVDGEPMSGSLFDFGLYFFHNAKEALARGTGPYFYLPKMESHLEARLWNDVFDHAQDALGIPRGTIRATVLIETLPAAFEMDEILYELRTHAAGLNAGRWDYMFSAIKKTLATSTGTLPDRAQMTMTVPFMRAYTELLVKTCHRRGAHAIGGMAAFIPSRKDAAVNEIALARVREDKQRESADGFDGTWVAHPDLVPIAQEQFDKVLGSRPNQKEKLRNEVSTTAAQLSDVNVPNGTLSEAGVRTNVNVALQYLDSWMRGIGAAAIHNLMEDAATAEISRAQLWQWVHRGAKLTDGRVVNTALYASIRDEELAKLGGRHTGRLADATALLDDLVLGESFADFLTLGAYSHLE